MKRASLILAAFVVSAGLALSAQTQQGKTQQQSQTKQSSMMQQGNMGTMQGNRPMMQRGMYNRGMRQQGMGMGMGMGYGMCPMSGQMMQQRPMMKYMMMVNHLPQMQEQLSLSQEQAEKLIDLQADFRKQQAKQQAAMARTHQELQALLDKMAPADQVKQQLQQCANARLEIGLAAYETARKMKDVLTADQKEQMKNMMMQQGGMMQQGQGGMMQQGQGSMMQGQGGMMQ